MKLVATIESEFKKILLIGLGISLVAIVVFSIFSAKETVEKATIFIESHISKLTESEINLQSVSEIDRKIAQVYSSWIESQGIDLRISVFIDDKMIAHAGQLQKFGLFSFSSEKTLHLPSGNKVLLVVDVDLWSLVFFVFVTTFFVCMFLLLCFWQLRKRMRRSLLQISKPLEDRIDWLKDISSHLPGSLVLEAKTAPSQIEELLNLDKSFETFISRLRLLEKKVSEKSFSEGRVKMAEQVAHSLKGAIGTLDLLLKNNQTLPQNVETEIRASIAKMVNVSAGILDLKKSEARQLLASTDEKFNPVTAIKSVMEQKARLFPTTNLKLIVDNGFEGLVYGPRVDFETTISDLVDNAIDAAPKGPIEVNINSTKSSVEIVIADWGTGITPEILPQLMQEGVTFKTNGNGLGLFHARTTVEAMTGKIEIESKTGIGTKIKLSVPRIENESIEIVAGQKVVLVDDDELIHKAWDLLLTPYGEKISLIHLQSKNEFEEWISVNGSGSFGERFYIFDYDLKADLTGIDLIEKYNLRLEATIISGMADAPDVLARARGAKIKLLNKNGLPRTKIKVIETETKTPLEAVNQ